jgi:hypothetical protein
MKQENEAKENKARERSNKQQHEASDRTKQVLRESIKMRWWKREKEQVV